MSGEGRTRLTSWKEIAAHLRREVRTVVRWEKERGLPVHRVPGGRGRSVFAFTDELDRWAAGADSEPAAPRSAAGVWKPRWLAAATIAIVAVAAAGIVTAWPRAEIAQLAMNASGVSASSAAAKPLWSFRFPTRNVQNVGRQTAIADLTGDGHADALAAADLMPATGAEPNGTLYAIDSGGRTLWTASLDDSLAFGSGVYDAPWQPDDVMAFTRNGEPRVAWALHHYTWWPSILALFDASGRRLGTFVNAGWIRMVQATVDGHVLIAGGFSNSRNGAAFALLDADHPSGSSPEDPGSPYACRNCPDGRPRKYITVDWTDVAGPPESGDRSVSISVSAAGTISLRALQRYGTDAIVELSSSLEVTRAALSDSFWDAHASLEREHALTHDRAHCPFRDGPIVREWTPAHGWRTVRG